MTRGAWYSRRRCNCANWWLTICIGYIIFTCFLSLRQSQENQKAEMNETQKSKFPTVRLYGTLRGERHHLDKPVVYHHLIVAPPSRKGTTHKPAVFLDQRLKNNPSNFVPQQLKDRKEKEHAERVKLEVLVNKKDNKLHEPKAIIGEAGQMSRPSSSLNKQGGMQGLRQQRAANGAVKDNKPVALNSHERNENQSEDQSRVPQDILETGEGAKASKQSQVLTSIPRKSVKMDKKSEKETKQFQQKTKKDGRLDHHGNRSSLYLSHQTGFIGEDGKVILLWTGLTARKPQWNFKSWSLKKCPHKCQITNERKYLNQSSLVLFRLRMLRNVPNKDLREFVKAYDTTDLPAQKYPNQVWVDLNQESPMYSHSDEELTAVESSFDYIVSYLDQSDYTIDYKYQYRRKTTPTKPVNYAANKTKMALWYVSHCNDLSGRAKYVKELTKYNISVDIIGKCTNKTDGCQGYKDIKCVNNFRSQYKFYLAFENSICSEYITEKYWNTLNSPSYTIPVALGARMQEYATWSPPNSYLHVRNFTGAKALAKHLHTIDRDDSRFNFYHSWRERFEMYAEKREPFDCWLCRMAHEQPTSNRSLYSQFWSRKKLCERQPEPI